MKRAHRCCIISRHLPSLYTQVFLQGVENSIFGNEFSSNMYMHTSMRKHMHTYINKYTHASIHQQYNLNIPTYVHACLHPSIHLYTHSYKHTFTRVSIDLFKQTYLHVLMLNSPREMWCHKKSNTQLHEFKTY